MGHTIIAEIITILFIFTTYTAKSQSTEDTTIGATDSITTEQIYTTIERTDVVTELITAAIQITDGPTTTESTVTTVHPDVSTITNGGSAPAENSDTSTTITPAPPEGVSNASTVAPPADTSSYTSIVGGLPADTSYSSTVSALPGVSPNTSTVAQPVDYSYTSTVGAPPEVISDTSTVASPGVTPNTSTVAPPADNSYSSTVAAPGVTPNTSTVVPPVDTSYTSTVAFPGVTPNTTTVALPGVSSNTSSIVQITTPGPSGLPTFDTVTLQGPYVINRQWIEFYCNFSSNVTDPNARFLATFLSGSQPLYNTSGPSRSFTLHEKYLAGKLGTSISCKVQSFWNNNNQTLSIPQTSSNSYTIGIEPPQTDYSVSEADWNPDIVRIKSTLPITCDSGVLTNCNLPFRLTTTSDIVLQKQGSDGCSHAFKELDWKASEQRAYSNDTTASVFAKKDLFVTGPRYNRLSIRFSVPQYKTVNGVTYPNIWYNYVAEIPIYHHDDSRAVCSSSGDPHLFTFDNVYYSTYSSGQFVYIQNKVGSPFEVHVRHWPCFYLVACICGVAVREGSTILGVDMCTDGIPHYFTYTKGALPTGFSLMKSRNGDYFEITVPSGNKISGNIWNPVISIQVYVTSDAKGSLEGMCGSFDNIRNNDIANRVTGKTHYISEWDWSAQGPSDFLESWRIPKGKSLFDGFLSSSPSGNNGPSRVEYCQCSAQTSNCGSNVANQDNTPNSQLYPAQPKVPFKSAGGARRKRATADDTTDYDYSYNTNAYNLTTLNSSTENWVFSWPTRVNLITNVTAYENCYSVLWGNSPLRTACNGSISSSDVDEFVQKCMQDVQISDSLDQAKDKIPELQNRCIYNSLSTNNSDQPAANTSTLIQNVLTVVNQITAVACIPVDCNSHGTCVNGSCFCSPDYIGSDCAIDKNAVPRLLKSIDPSLCDAHSSSCSSITMMTANVTSLPSLACKVVVQKINNAVTPYTTTATILSRDATSCALPAEALQSFSNYKNFTVPQQTDFNSLTPGSPSQVYSVSMSNDGAKYGDPLTVTLYDSLCYDCSTTPCHAKSTACLIRGYCFADSAQNPLNSHYACKIDRSTTDWTYSAAATLFINQSIITLVFVLATLLNVIG